MAEDGGSRVGGLTSDTIAGSGGVQQARSPHTCCHNSYIPVCTSRPTNGSRYCRLLNKPAVARRQSAASGARAQERGGNTTGRYSLSGRAETKSAGDRVHRRRRLAAQHHTGGAGARARARSPLRDGAHDASGSVRVRQGGTNGGFTAAICNQNPSQNESCNNTTVRQQPNGTP